MIRFTAPAAEKLRRAIREAGGVEVFAIGEVADGTVTSVTVTCRGTENAVPALFDRPRTGQVVIHNHPSGDLRPSAADMDLAGRYGDGGTGVVIVDSAVTRDNWVVEPHAKKAVRLDPAAVRAVFEDALPRAYPGWEPREAQITMALGVAAALSEERPYAVEAGTGTGKSLAYLVPAAMWALANDGRVAISTYTRSLQAQLVQSDLPVLAKAGIPVRTAVLMGRNNYLCKRRLQLALDEDADQSVEERNGLEELRRWAETTRTGMRGEIPFPVDPLLWERSESDADLTLRVRCPHYSSCHYYTARREATGAHLVVVNHALLLADRAIRDVGANGVLPDFGRVILDEAHHIEQAATSAVGERVSHRAVQRAVAPALGRRRRRGSLDRLLDTQAGHNSDLPSDRRMDLPERVEMARASLERARREVPEGLEDLATQVLGPQNGPLRVTADMMEKPLFLDVLEPQVAAAAEALEDAGKALTKLDALFDDNPPGPGRSQPLLDLRRVHRRLVGQAAILREWLDEHPDFARWAEPMRDRERVFGAIVRAPIDVAPTLRRILWDPLPGSIATSATLAVGHSFGHWQAQVGLWDAECAVLPSPFDHRAQALLALPRDLPTPNHDSFLRRTSECVVQAARAAHGGVFVLATSYEAVKAYAAALRRAEPGSLVLAQGETPRSVMLQRFIDHPGAVLVGTDSFWEGVSVKGDTLRLVIIPRLPFRVPSDPLQEARVERITSKGKDAFRAYSLPHAVIRLRQGYGRLIRSKTDRGVVLILDRRIHERSYGALMIRSLPDARRLNTNWKRVEEELVSFFREMRDSKKR
ncbi:MAG: helicase [Proteobacteria bacterium]|nr:helicase [Pseudomonadota bacterium]